MSEFLAEHPKNLEWEWIEFKERVFVEGIGYVESVALADGLPEMVGRPRCRAFWMKDDYWGFLFKNGSACMVHANSVRYVKLRQGALPNMKGEDKGVTEPLKASEHLGEEMVHTSDSTPKRRGRPPKARAE